MKRARWEHTKLKISHQAGAGVGGKCGIHRGKIDKTFFSSSKNFRFLISLSCVCHSLCYNSLNAVASSTSSSWSNLKLLSFPNSIVRDFQVFARNVFFFKFFISSHRISMISIVIRMLYTQQQQQAMCGSLETFGGGKKLELRSWRWWWNEKSRGKFFAFQCVKKVKFTLSETIFHLHFPSTREWHGVRGAKHQSESTQFFSFHHSLLTDLAVYMTNGTEGMRNVEGNCLLLWCLFCISHPYIIQRSWLKFFLSTSEKLRKPVYATFWWKSWKISKFSPVYFCLYLFYLHECLRWGAAESSNKAQACEKRWN